MRSISNKFIYEIFEKKKKLLKMDDVKFTVLRYVESIPETKYK